MPGGQEEQEIENLFEQIMKENFPSLAKEIDFQEVQEAQRVPKKLDPRKHTLRHIIITVPQIKDKERTLKAVSETGDSYLTKEFPPDHQLFLKRNLAGKKWLERSIQNHERQGPTSKIALSSKAII